MDKDHMIAPYYSADGITLYHADCDDVLPQIGPIDCLLTDPPYGLGARWQGTVGSGKGNGWGGFTQEMLADCREWDSAPYPRMAELVASAREAIIWGGNYYAMPPSRCWLVWEKSQRLPTMADCELAWTSFDRPAKSMKTTRNVDGLREHPTQKPVRIMRWCLEFFGPGVIVDPFAGSGTTLIAARDAGRQAIGIEREEKYCAVAVQRLRQTVLPFGES